MIDHNGKLLESKVDVWNWHVRYICKLCGFHRPIEFEPNTHDNQLQVCEECSQAYKDEWEYGMYKLVKCEKWYNPFSWNKTKWINKITGM